ncbi:MAG: lipid-A-disaccharide synthase [Rikenellaceae bacterium]
MKYFLIAGEPSGDMHGANLMRGILAEDPEAEFRFWGGDKMAEVGGEQGLLKHYRESSFFGFLQVVLNLRTILAQMDACRREITSFAPDVLILIDYAGFNLKMAKHAHSIGIKTHFYIAPKVWAWNEKRVKIIRKYVDELFIIFPFEKEYFRRHQIEAHFEGNPLLDALELEREALPSREAFCSKNNLSADRQTIALLSGSRRGEIFDNLPIMVAASRSFPEYEFVVAGVDWIDRALYEKILEGSSVRLIFSQTYSLVQHSHAAIVTSGTATLETALLGTPEVVLYKLNPIIKLLKPLLLKIPYISLVNLVLGREAVCEITQASANPKRLIAELGKILSGSERERMLNDYKELQEKMGKAGASHRFAAKMTKLIKQ